MEKNDLDKIELYSEDVQELMARPPASIIRYGAAALLGTIIFVLGLSFFIKYPDTVKAPAIITATNPSAFIMAAASGDIDYITVKNGDEVKANQVLAILDTSGYQNELKVKAYVALVDKVMAKLAPDAHDLPVIFNISNLGSLQKPFLKFRLMVLQAKYQPGNNEYKMAMLEESVSAIKASISLWEKQNLLIAPINGKIAFTKHALQKSRLNTGSLVFVITPKGRQDFTALITLPKSAAGQVRVGQDAKISLTNYQAHDHGLLTGKLTAIDNLSQSNTVQAVVQLTAGLKTDTGEEITYVPDMQGQAEIFLQNLSVGDRIFGSAGLFKNRILK